VLYFIDLTYGSVGQGRVSVNDLARWFRVSKPTVVKFVAKMIENGLVTQHRISAKTGHGFILKYSMTVAGKTHLDDHYDAAYALYRVEVAKILAAILQKNVEDEYWSLTPKEKRQIEAGQKELF